MRRSQSARRCGLLLLMLLVVLVGAAVVEASNCRSRHPMCPDGQTRMRPVIRQQAILLTYAAANLLAGASASAWHAGAGLSALLRTRWAKLICWASPPGRGGNDGGSRFFGTLEWSAR